MKTVLETIQAGAEYLEKKSVENGRLNMQHLVAHVLECDRMQLYVEFDRPLGEEELAPLRELLRRRSEGEPLQHLLGKVSFAGHDFVCDKRALVPRPETEELVERLVDRHKEGDRPRAVLDMGTGTGVIGLSLAAAWRECVDSVVLADFSPDALTLARENVQALRIADMEAIEVIETDLFSALGGRQFDLIVANLPYIAAEELAALSREVQRDPVMALAGGSKGTEIMERFVAEAPAYLVDGGAIAMEFGMGQAEGLKALLLAADWKDVDSESDFSGVERFLFASR